MKTFGLIGCPLSHSFSKKYFTEKFQKENISAKYELYELESFNQLPKLLEDESLCGFNVTIPYKETIIPLMDEIDELAQAIGAVNCVKVIRKGRKILLKGFNTDAYGFKESLKPFLCSRHQRALILGTGGSSKAVGYILKQIGVQVTFVSRNGQGPNIISYDNLNENLIRAHLLIVNTSPLGMFPASDSFPELPYDAITHEHLLYDLIYNPTETVFLKKGKQRGAEILNGLSMLHFQAEKSYSIFNS